MFNVVPRKNCVTYWLVTYTRTKRKDRPFIIMLKFLRKKNHNFLQSTIENQQKGCYLMSWSTPGTHCLRTRSAPGTLFFSAILLEELIQLYLGSLRALCIYIKSTGSALGPQTKSTRCAPGHQKQPFCRFSIVPCKKL